MTEYCTEKLRIYADFNSCMADHRGEWCWLLRHNGALLDDVADALGLSNGMRVTLYYKDEAEEFEFDAVLEHIAVPGSDPRWKALFDQSTFRRLRG